jgi:hypothetical protein
MLGLLYLPRIVLGLETGMFIPRFER